MKVKREKGGGGVTWQGRKAVKKSGAHSQRRWKYWKERNKWIKKGRQNRRRKRKMILLSIALWLITLARWPYGQVGQGERKRLVWQWPYHMSSTLLPLWSCPCLPGIHAGLLFLLFFFFFFFFFENKQINIFYYLLGQNCNFVFGQNITSLE